MNKLNELRKKKGKTATEMARELGLTQATISRWERGQLNPSGKSLILLSNYFNVPIDYMLSEDNETESTNAKIGIFGNKGDNYTFINGNQKYSNTANLNELDIEMLETFQSLHVQDKIKAINYLYSLKKEKGDDI